MDNTNTLGGRIQAGRKAAGLSQEALGERLGVSRQAVSKWEADAAVPELENLIAMSRIFGITIGALLGVESPAQASDRAEPTPEENQETAGPGDTVPSPAGELTERELAAAEAIAEKYLAAAQAHPRWSRRRKIAAAAAGCALVLGVALAGNWMTEQLNEIRRDLARVETATSQEIQSISLEMGNILEQQNKIISNYTVQVQDYRLEAETMPLSVSVCPKEFSQDTEAQFTLRTASGELYTATAQRSGGTFWIDGWEVPMDSPAELSAAFTSSGTTRTEFLETRYDSPEDFQLSVSGSWDTTWKSETLLLGGLTLHIDSNDQIPLELVDVELAIFPNGETEPLWSSPLPEAVKLWQEQGYVQIYLTTECYMPRIPLADGDEILAAARITDDHGQSFWYLLGSWQNSGGQLLSEHPDMLNDWGYPWQPGQSLPL